MIRPEYPRPDFQRGQLEGHDWLNLNGPWQFRFDPDRRGTDDKWFAPDPLEWREQIIVPFCWESLAAWNEADAAGNDNYYSTRVFRNPLEVTRENHRSAPRYEVGWYRRTIEIPDNPAWQDKRVILKIGAADFFTDCWCNGVHLGHHEGGYTPFEFDITDALPTENGRRTALLVLRVEDPMDNSEQPVGKQWRWYTTTSGIWQTVYVEPRSRAHIQSIRTLTDIDAKTVTFRITCAEAPQNATLRIQITSPTDIGAASPAPPYQLTLNSPLPLDPANQPTMASPARTSQPSTLNPQLSSQPSTLNPQLSSQPSTLNPQLPLDPAKQPTDSQPSTLNPPLPSAKQPTDSQPSTLNSQLSGQPSTLNSQLSSQPSTPDSPTPPSLQSPVSSPQSPVHAPTPLRSSQPTLNSQLSTLNSLTAPLDPMILWDPNHPHLYDVRIDLLHNGHTLDTVRTYFGMRKIDFEPPKEQAPPGTAQPDAAPAALRLNGVARYLRGALHQSYYPDGVYTATSVETLKNDIACAKNFGFNFLRIHIKIDDPLLLYWADKLGMLLMADFPNFGEGGDTPLGRSRFQTMMREAIERDANHPSIFAWCLFNETWGFGGQASFLDHLKAPPPTTGLPPEPENPNRPAKPKMPAAGARPGMTQPQVWVQQMWELAKKLDPTRLVEDMSVCHWEHLEYYLHCDTDINSWHFYIRSYEKAKAHIDKIVRDTFVGSTFNYVPGFKHKGQPLINSEYGGVGALDGDRDVSWSFKFLTNELRRHQQIAAYIYTELHDVEWEYNGFLNYDRTPKEFGYNPRIINESNTLPIDSPPVQRLAPGQTLRVDVASSHYSTRRHENVWLHWTLDGMDTRGRTSQHLQRGRVQIPFPHRRVAHAHTIELRLPDTPMLCTLRLRAHTPDGTAIAENFLHYLVSAGYPPEREETPRALILRGTPANWSHADWSGGTGDRDKERAEDACYGFGHGFFEWNLPLNGVDICKARRIKVLCESSSHRSDWPQTDSDIFPTTMEMQLNGVRLYRAVLRNHPHDSRGVLSYLRGGVGGYGYLAHGFAENDSTIAAIKSGGSQDELKLRCAVPPDAPAIGGLTIYGAECGRYPVSPTVILEW